MRTIAIVLFSALAVSCLAGSSEPTESPRAPAAAPAASPVPLDYVERCLGAPCESPLPTLVAIHGLGDTPEAFVSLFDGIRVPVRVIALRAPLDWNGGFAWFPYRARSSTPEQMAGALREQVPRVLATLDAVCRARSCDGRNVVSGFSQGAMMSFALVALSPTRFSHAFPVSGMLVSGLTPASQGPRPVVRAFHGDADTVVATRFDVEGVERLRSAGYDVSIVLGPGVAHTIPPDTRDALLRGIEAALPPLH